MIERGEWMGVYRPSEGAVEEDPAISFRSVKLCAWAAMVGEELVKSGDAVAVQ